MKKQNLLAAGVALILAAAGCKKEQVDTQYPTIETLATAFPQQCSEIKRGQKMVFNAKFSDNVELGAISVDIHHNFDGHNHSTEVSNCTPEAPKKAVNPFLLIKSFDIPTGQKTYQINQEIDVPADVDPGDYHFLIRLTDKEGWQTIKGISIKIK